MQALHRSLFRRPTIALTTLMALAGCSTVENLIQGDKVDYRSQAVKTAPLEIPPDLSQLQRDGRYAPASGSVSANTYQAGGATLSPAAAAAIGVAPNAMGELRIVREGNQRWLVVPMSADQLWPQLREFWTERGFSLVIDNPQAGVMETDWAENRAKIPQDIVRRTIGRVIDGLYDTGERDRFRTRVERSANGSEIYLSHRGMSEEFFGDRNDARKDSSTMWVPRPSDPGLEAEFLTRLLVKLGAKEATAREVVAKAAPAATTGAARARAVAGQPALQVDEGFDRAWRRVGLALDRSGFTVEDRDRAGGLYFVRYVDPSKAATAAEEGFFSKLFSFGKSDGGAAPVRYRIALKGEGDKTSVTVQNSQGSPEPGDAAQRIVALLVDDLK
jgi:outer membrane protein assembly factor BamC